MQPQCLIKIINHLIIVLDSIINTNFEKINIKKINPKSSVVGAKSLPVQSNSVVVWHKFMYHLLKACQSRQMPTWTGCVTCPSPFKHHEQNYPS